MPSDFQLGCTYNFLQKHVVVSPLERFQMVRDAGVFDYINWLPPLELVKDCIAAAEKTGIPMTTGNSTHTFGRQDPDLTDHVRRAADVDMAMLNVMLAHHTTEGVEISDSQILDTYRRAAELGSKLGVKVSFELHVDCWSEKFKRVTPIIQTAREQGLDFNFTLDYSHVVFKIDNPEQQEVSDVREDVVSGRVILDPFEAGNLCSEWLALNVVSFAQFRAVVPNNPRNIWGKNPDGSLPRGILYPFTKPEPGQWHSPWQAYRLETCKEAFRTILRHHLTQPASPLKYVITEMIGTEDYGQNAKFSLLEQNAACARWIRDSWSQLKAMNEAGIPLKI